MPLSDYVPGYNPDPYKKLVEGLDTALGDGDAIALLPYDDGTLYPKRAYFEKDLIGGIGGYETADGDKIAVDGTGEAVRSLFGVDIVLGVDPTEHAAAVDPIKALIAHKKDIGEWIRVDRRGDVVQIGPAMEPPPVVVNAADVDEVMEEATDDELLQTLNPDYDAETFEAGLREQYLADIEVEPDLVTDKQIDDYVDQQKAEMVAQNIETIEQIVEAHIYNERVPDVSPEGIVADGGMVGEFLEQERQKGKSMTFDEALNELRQRGDVTTVFDIAPPAGMYLDDDGEVQVEEATHIAVDQSKAADLLPKKWDTVKLNTMIDKARMEEYEEGKFMKYLTYGIIIGAVGTITVVIVMFLMMSISGGIF